MKRTLLFAATIVFGLSCHSLLAAANLLPNGSFENGLTGWNPDGIVAIDTTPGQQTSGTASALLGGTTSIFDEGSVTSLRFPTTPGTTYTAQLDAETLDGTSSDDHYVEFTARDGTSNNQIGYTYFTPSTKFTTFSTSFTATGTSSYVEVYGYDQEVVDNVIVSTGSFSEPGKYTGSVKQTTAISSLSISSFSTQSVVARITPSGGLTLIEQPSGWLESGGFVSNSSIAYSGTTDSVTISDKDHIKFTSVSNDNENDVPYTYTQTFVLHKVGK
jgi:hypothetical protein